MVSRSDFAGRPLCVIFMCNHCPFVVHIRAALSQFASEYQTRGLAVVGISSNDVGSHPQDGPQQMRRRGSESWLQLSVPVRSVTGCGDCLPRRLHA
ncbi:MAG UNVERIFIED_CONTAM: redoxin domain-containing protein [Planctomycetaceae bacterium]